MTDFEDVIDVKKSQTLSYLKLLLPTILDYIKLIKYKLLETILVNKK
jgi:hypothetical protein